MYMANAVVTFLSKKSTMPNVHSSLSIFLFYLCLCGFYLANVTSGDNTTEPEITDATPEEPESAGSSNLPISSRILDGKPLNLTSFVSIESSYQVEEDPSTSLYLSEPSTTLRCPLSTKNMDFKPSIHIGEIDEYESRKSDDLVKNPLNPRVEKIKFDETVRIDESVDNDEVRVPTSSFRDGVSISGTHKIPVKFFETDGRYSLAVPVDLVHHQQQQQEHYEQPQQIELQISAHHQDAGYTDQANSGDASDHAHNQNSHSNGQHALVTFEYPRPSVYATARPLNLVRPLYPSTMKEPLSVYYQQPPRQQNPYQQHQYTVPSDNLLASVHLKPSKLHDDTVTSSPNNIHHHHYQYTPIASGEAIEKPEVQSFHPPSANYATGNYLSENNYQPIISHDDQSHHIAKPDTLYYVSSHHESAVTRMRKFPYKFYDPSLVGQHQDNGYHYSIQEVPPNFPSKERRVSPWKKIIHLIGAFLPLGLLLATLKPNVVKIENTTQPNIVLSKLRGVDLPAEHKRGRLVDKVQPDMCDDRSICELIVSGSQPSSNLLQNILWNFTNRSTEEEAQKHGLQEIFAAVKKKDCSLVDC